MAKAVDRQSGVVLIVTLWIILGMTATAIYFAHAVRMQQWREASVSATRQAEAALVSAAAYIAAVLEGTPKGTMPATEDELLCNAVPVGNATFWVLGRPHPEAADPRPVFALTDEAGKLNLNTATLEMLMALPGMTTSIAAAIIDWRDRDDEPSPQGAEAEVYSRLERPYRVKNAPFSTAEELRLVEGVDAGLLFGRDANLNGVVEDGEAAPTVNLFGLAAAPSLDRGWLSYLTVWSREPATQPDGMPRVNVNDQDTRALEELLRTSIDHETAVAVMSAARPGRSQFRSTLEFYMRSGMNARQFSLIDDAITVSDQQEFRGLVNVNSASAVVLACLPGIDETSARQLVAYRVGHPETLDSIAWVAEILEREAALQAGPYLTTRSYQFAADLVAVGEGGRGYRRTLAVFDTSGQDIRIVYQRDRTALGWALGAAVRKEMRP